MRVLVTGATGFVGYHTTRALLAAGHDVSLLVRSVDKMLRLFGDDTIAHYTRGDIGDRTSVRRALAGCEAVIHSAASVSTAGRDAQRVFATNVTGARTVLGEALEHGVTLAIHVSSVTALYNPRAERLDHTTPAAGGARSGYGRSKVACEEYARALQAQGAPVHITYPGSVIGPDDPGFTEPHRGLKYLLYGLVPALNSGNQYIDVRDLAQAHLRIIERQPAPDRFPLGGTFLSWREHAQLLGRLTGRHFFSPPMPALLPRLAGHCLDRMSSLLPADIPITAEGMQYATHWVPLDDSHTLEVLELSPRPFDETMRDTLNWLRVSGHIANWQVGKLARHTPR